MKADPRKAGVVDQKEDRVQRNIQLNTYEYEILNSKLTYKMLKMGKIAKASEREREMLEAKYT